MGIGKNGFYTLKDILKEKAKINWIYSDRNDGKSFAVKERALRLSLKHKKPMFCIVKRNDVDIKTDKIEKYFVDRNINLIEKLTNGEFTHVRCRGHNIYLAGYDDNGKEYKSNYAVGEYYALSTAIHEKSTGHICDIIIAEEIMTDGVYLEDEPSKFMHLLSTLVRSDDENVEVYVIGNNINSRCPYFKEWGMKNIFKQKAGTIDTYYYTQIDGSKVKIACERIKPRDDKKSGLFIGKAEKSIQGGQWETREYPKLFKPFKEFEVIDMITYKSSYDVAYTIALIIDDTTGALYCYVYPAHHTAERVLTAEFSSNPLHTPKLNKTNRIDVLIHNCFVDNKVMYSDSLTGTDFHNCIKQEKINPIF